MKRIAILIFVAFFAISAQAQKFNFGLKASPSLAWLKPDTKGIASDGSKIGFSYGILMDYNFGDNYSLGTGVDITYRGGKLVTEDTTFSANIDYKLQYIEIPFTLKMKTNEIGYLTYFAQFGFAPGVNIKAKADTETKISGQTSINETDIDISKDINTINLAMIISLGAQYSLGGKTSLMTGLSFNNGFTDIADSKDLKVSSNYIALMIGVFF